MSNAKFAPPSGAISSASGNVAEVAASSTPSEVISAIVTSASSPPQRTSNPNRWLLFGFFFLVIFASIVSFREEIYTFTTDIHKYPILSVVEASQVRKYLGSGWTFGTGQDQVHTIDPDAAAAVSGADAATGATGAAGSTGAAAAAAPAAAAARAVAQAAGGALKNATAAAAGRLLRARFA
ncbi:hypothetical protein CHLRE_17g706400v5 [Chlamydomonas reinhardtii]|uniref:Uncharacterized protein n=1 Tax=Chlamydomonas reinhardtii TaxID=3055 RepID=A8IRC3_CHLRE|nr:uncharacterized protein CHLRE_17g706400v5 [Chlamydomonas reinhardtii]PNW70118.1 hypothetical protein CHLRE_17g706400v5 [Chlamydomonas reinhardtii]|eukprot:XP_001691559.1 predicted protein [Chlamydomonas reinhardtii]